MRSEDADMPVPAVDSNRDPDKSAAPPIARHKLLGEINGLASIEVSPTGKLDIESADDFRRASARMLDSGITQFYVDLENLQYIDSTGLGSLLSLYREAKSRGGAVRIYNVTPPVESIFTVTHLDKVLEIYRTRQAALSEVEET